MAKILNNDTTSLRNSGGQIMTAADMEIYSDIVHGDHFRDNDPFGNGNYNDPFLDRPTGGGGGSGSGNGGNGNSGGTANYDPDPDGIDKWDEENRNDNQDQPAEKNKLIKYVAYAAIALGILKLIKR